MSLPWTATQLPEIARRVVATYWRDGACGAFVSPDQRRAVATQPVVRECPEGLRMGSGA